MNQTARYRGLVSVLVAALTTAPLQRAAVVSGEGRCPIRTIALCLLFVSGIASAASQASKTEEQIVEAAKVRSEHYCHGEPLGSYKKAGCEYFAKRYQGKWSVIVHLIYVDGRGKRVAVSDADRIYEYDLSGRFIHDLMDN